MHAAAFPIRRLANLRNSLPALLLIAALAGVAMAQDGGPEKEKQERIREGTILTDQMGVFKIRGDRAEFLPDGAEKGFIGLENLNLSRISQMVSESPEELHWVVTGLITEFNGANYLLVTRAMRKTNTFQPRTEARFSPTRTTLPSTIAEK